jgi:hypothetical protein
VEHSILKAAGQGLAPIVHHVHSGCTIRTPKFFPCDLPASTQVQECLPNCLDLKRYALKYFSASDVSKTSVLEIGQGLGMWLRSFHDWAAGHDTLREAAKSNVGMMNIKLKYNYELLLSRVDKFPAILSDAKTEFEAVLAMAKSELEDEAKLQVVHGDFWTGKYVCTRILKLKQSPRLMAVPVFYFRTRISHQATPHLFSLSTGKCASSGYRSSIWAK